ncbi:MAG: thioredoxin-disulfide reductase [Rickettsiaceae bacterium H1]|nr:thioredoxin-disulfide reductase [Rickettsiaceae bacterium H1]
MAEHYTKNLIIGSGPAGYTAAIYAARANMKPILVQGNSIGGQLTITTDVENYPGFAKPIKGPQLMDEMSKQASNVKTKLIFDHISSVKQMEEPPFEFLGESGDLYKAETVVIATGAEAKWLGLRSEEKFKGYGVSGCATCDGFFFKNQKVLVVGGGNTAVEEALYLTNHASKVILVHRRDQLRAEKILQDRLFKNNKVEVLWNHVLHEILGDDEPKKVTRVLLKSIIDNKVREINISGIFIAIGHKPNTGIFHKLIEMDNGGYIITKPDSTATNIPGVYAAGDVQDKIYRQAVTAAGTGCMAALEAQKFLDERGL